jgi:prophage maintenance system killer protein
MDIWYPPWELYLETHDRMLEVFGGHSGLEYSGQTVFEAAMIKIREYPGDIYEKAGVMLERLRTDRIVKDAQKRTAYTTTAIFLEINGEQIHVSDPEKASNFIKNILKYDHSEIVEWIKHGQIPT